MTKRYSQIPADIDTELSPQVLLAAETYCCFLRWQRTRLPYDIDLESHRRQGERHRCELNSTIQQQGLTGTSEKKPPTGQTTRVSDPCRARASRPLEQLVTKRAGRPRRRDNPAVRSLTGFRPRNQGKCLPDSGRFRPRSDVVFRIIPRSQTTFLRSFSE